MAEKTFVVSGIHCAGCESAIQSGLGRLEGVRRVKADHCAQTVTVSYTPGRLEEDRLADQLSRMGYSPVEDS